VTLTIALEAIQAIREIELRRGDTLLIKLISFFRIPETE
jgi:hypothetical protein